MEKKIKITAGGVTVEALLNNSQTAEKIWNALPIEEEGSTWGDEIYFSIPVRDTLAADAKEVVSLGELAYWPPGTAFCIFFGLTPASRGNEIRPASAVNPVGNIIGDPTAFKKVRSGAKVKIEKA
jgi:hypothetical protein